MKIKITATLYYEPTVEHYASPDPKDIMAVDKENIETGLVSLEDIADIEDIKFEFELVEE